MRAIVPSFCTAFDLWDSLNFPKARMTALIPEGVSDGFRVIIAFAPVVDGKFKRDVSMCHRRLLVLGILFSNGCLTLLPTHT